MAKVSIYVTDEMKAQMDETELNWSGIAQAAFSGEIAKRNWKKGDDMESVVERLKESKERYDKKESGRGYDDGVEWAKTKAEYEDLVKLSELELGRFWNDSYVRADCLGRWIDEELGQEGSDSIFEAYLPDHDKYPSDDYVEAFYKGAVEVWDSVKEALQ